MRASAPGSPGGTSQPVSPSRTTSGVPPTAVATTALLERERLEGRHGQPFAPRGQHGEVGGAEVRRRARLHAGERDGVADAELGDARLERLVLVAAADEQEPGVRQVLQHLREGRDEHVDALLREMARKADDERAAVGDRSGRLCRAPRARSPRCRRLRGRPERAARASGARRRRPTLATRRRPARGWRGGSARPRARGDSSMPCTVAISGRARSGERHLRPSWASIARARRPA